MLRILQCFYKSYNKNRRVINLNTNLVVLTGRLTAEPDLKYTQSGKTVAKFSLAVGRIKKEETDFINCVAWEKTAELVGQYLGKGSKCLVYGSIRTGSYEKEGQKIKTFDVWVNTVEFLDNNKKQIEEKPKNSDDEEFPF
jgi:single-strand DNA-binding protein